MNGPGSPRAEDGRRRTVQTADGARLAVYEYGPRPGPDTPSILLVHGYPDDHTVFAEVIGRLSPDFHVIAYDTRNAGDSTAPGSSLAHFRLDLLTDDLFAVIAATGVDSVYLAGHDWGSIQGWRAVRDPRAVQNIRGFTSISGPDLDHFGRWLRFRLSSPRRWIDALNQGLRSTYVAVFQIPRLPEAAWRLFLTRFYERRTGRRIGTNGIRGLALYRANVRAFGSRSAAHSTARRSGNGNGRRPGRQSLVPVHVVVPLRDPFISPRLTRGLDAWVPDLTVTAVQGGHWWPADEAAAFAGHLSSRAATGRQLP